ncbi:response regulator [Noviherbaspirillum sp.]|uniref:response regulator n=1 Tax=Noviherbaspirillum sp. TaxID=1926288 RepID=UPI002B492E6C|nr:response regulator [Noviherbaspirillum sp.]HJV80825.1 response regulator [Noviherbaspirillum sp.]
MAKLLLSFSRSDLPSIREVKETGLDLYLCQKPVDPIGARLTVSGNFVQKRCPVSYEKPVSCTRKTSAVATEVVPMPACILFVKDNPADMELMAYLPGLAGRLVLYAHNQRETLASAPGEQPDLIICDMNLPHLDGYAVARHFRAAPAMRSIPAVAITAPTISGDGEECLDAGFNGCVSKPLDPETFVDSIETFLRGDDMRERPNTSKNRLQQRRSQDGNDPDR